MTWACSEASLRACSSRRWRYSAMRAWFGSVTAELVGIGGFVAVLELLLPENAMAPTMITEIAATTIACVFLGRIPTGLAAWFSTTGWCRISSFSAFGIHAPWLLTRAQFDPLLEQLPNVRRFIECHAQLI